MSGSKNGSCVIEVTAGDCYKVVSGVRTGGVEGAFDENGLTLAGQAGHVMPMSSDGNTVDYSNGCTWTRVGPTQAPEPGQIAEHPMAQSPHAKIMHAFAMRPAGLTPA
jgi:hypothetical protein